MPITYEELRARIAPEALAILDDASLGESSRGRVFEKLGRPPTVDEIRYDFGYGYALDEVEKPTDTWCLDPATVIHVLLARIDELERGR